MNQLNYNYNNVFMWHRISNISCLMTIRTLSKNEFYQLVVINQV